MITDTYISTHLSQYCSGNYEDIENYEKALSDTSERWVCHHRLETHFKNGKRRERQLSKTDLIDEGLYWKRPPEELIFLTNSSHTSLHMENNDYSKGQEPWNKGKTGVYSPSEEARKKLSLASKGKHWYNNGEVETLSYFCPEGFTDGRLDNISEETRKKLSLASKGKKMSEETRKKMSSAQKGVNTWTKGKHWYNNGELCVRALECPEGFIPGRLKRTPALI